MDPELKKELIEIRALVRDNHDMLRRMRQEQLWAFAIKILFWGIVIFLPLYFLQPYLENFPSIEQVQEAFKNVQVNGQ